MGLPDTRHTRPGNRGLLSLAASEGDPRGQGQAVASVASQPAQRMAAHAMQPTQNARWHHMAHLAERSLAHKVNNVVVVHIRIIGRHRLPPGQHDRTFHARSVNVDRADLSKYHTIDGIIGTRKLAVACDAGVGGVDLSACVG